LSGGGAGDFSLKDWWNKKGKGTKRRKEKQMGPPSGGSPIKNHSCSNISEPRTTGKTRKENPTVEKKETQSGTLPSQKLEQNHLSPEKVSQRNQKVGLNEEGDATTE